MLLLAPSPNLEIPIHSISRAVGQQTRDAHACGGLIGALRLFLGALGLIALFFGQLSVLTPGAHLDDLAVDHQETDAVAETHDRLVRQEGEYPRFLLQGDPLAEDRREQELLQQARYREGQDAVERGWGRVAEVEFARIQQDIVDHAEDRQRDAQPEGRDDHEAGGGAGHSGQRPHQESGGETYRHPRYLQPAQVAHLLSPLWTSR